MSMNIKNREVELLAGELAALTGESKTEAIRKALAERRLRLASLPAEPDQLPRLTRFLESDVRPLLARRRGQRVGDAADVLPAEDLRTDRQDDRPPDARRGETAATVP